MDLWKMFGSTFILIFLAELGDKTQLAAMARAADGPDGSTARWVVFLAASAALVLSTLIAVFFGGVLKSLVPDERYIKIAAGALFILFGIMILGGVVNSYRHEAAETARAPVSDITPDPGYLGGLALRAAVDFEAAVGDRYRRLAVGAGPELAKLLEALAEEEDSHLARLSRLSDAEKARAFTKSSRFRAGEVALVAAMTERNKDSENLVRELAQHEQATAEFYQSLADQTIIPNLKPLFAKLAEEERGHAARLNRLLET